MAEAINSSAPTKSKAAIAREMGVSRSSLYYQPKLPKKDLFLKTQIENIWTEHPAYGALRLAMHLKINKKRIIRVMKIFKMKVKRRRKIPVKKLDIGQKTATLPNLIQTEMTKQINDAWVADFTYLPFHGKFIYLSTIMDILTREIIAWNTSCRHDSELVSETLIQGVKKRGRPKIFHSDQGSEYKSEIFQTILKKYQVRQSMSDKSSPWQNSFQESFYSGFKVDLGHPESNESDGELTEAIAQTIYYYNNKRIHTALKMPPSIYAQRLKLTINSFNIGEKENGTSV